jgi:hypothetical protein
MDMKPPYITVLLAIISILCGCSAIAPIRTYTTASKNGVDAYVSLRYNFEQNCLASCRDQDIEAFRLTSVDCDCRQSKLADSINAMMANAVRAYINALGQLSEKDLATLPIPAFSESLQASPSVNVKLSQKEIDAYTTIADLITNALSGEYRKNKLKSFVSNAQTPLTIIINHLQLNQSKNLNGLIDIRIQRNKLMFYEHIRDKRYSPYQKREITSAYYKIYDRLEEQKLANLYHAQIMEEVKKGHTDLFNNLEAWNTDQVEKMMATNAATIESLIRKLEKLK